MGAPRFSINSGFRHLARSLRVQFEAARGQQTSVGHGEDVEAALIDMLRQFLPTRFGVGRGHLFDWASRRSDRLDVIIYDALNCPRFQRPDLLGYYPADCVLAIIEVTDTTLGQRKLARDSARIAGAKSLGWTVPVPPGFEDPGPCGTVFAARAVRDVQGLVKVFAARRQELIDADCGRQCLNAVVLMDRGVICYRHPWTGEIGMGPMSTATRDGETRLWEAFFADAGEDTLALYCALLLHRFQIQLEAQILGRANLVYCDRHGLDPRQCEPKLPTDAGTDAQVLLPDLHTYLWGATGGAGLVRAPTERSSPKRRNKGSQ